jgi:maltose O-acetyltransferase
MLMSELDEKASEKSERDKMNNGEAFSYFDPELHKLYNAAQNLLRNINITPVEDEPQRQHLLKALLGHLGAGARVKPPFQCDYGFNIRIGFESVLNYGCVVLDSGVVRIGDYVRIGPGVHIYTTIHPFDPVLRRANRVLPRGVTIGDDVWIAGRAIISPGVTIGDGAIIGAGSVVTKNVPPRVLAAGNPCSIIRNLVNAEMLDAVPSNSSPFEVGRGIHSLEHLSDAPAIISEREHEPMEGLDEMRS